MPNNHYEDIYQRIDRMEIKLDKLVDAVTELVRVEVTIQGMSNRLNNHAEQIEKLDNRQDELERKVPLYDQLVEGSKWVKRAAVTALVAGVVTAMLAAFLA